MLYHEPDGSWRCSRCDAEYYDHSDAVEHDENCSAEQEEKILERLEQLENQVNSLKGGVMKPCEIPCPKCGSLNIHREFYLAGDCANWALIPRHSCFIAPAEKVEHKPGEFRFGAPLRRAIKECFLHKCQICGWVWETDEIYKPET